MKPKYYVLVDEGHNQFSKWDADSLKEARKTKEVLRLDFLLERTQIVKVIG